MPPVFGDKHHKNLLDDRWFWSGTYYERSFAHGAAEGEAIRIHPGTVMEPTQLIEMRKRVWFLTIKVLDTDTGEYYWVRVCTYKNFIYAAAAVTGNF